MKLSQVNIIILLTIMFIGFNSVVYYFTERNQNERIQIAFNENIKDLETHYKVLLHNQSIAADSMYLFTTTTRKDVTILLEKALDSSEEGRVLVRKQLYDLLNGAYQIMKMQGVLQYHFIFPNNQSFLRFHKPKKFGDDLSTVREDFSYTNQTQKPIKGFAQGKTTHGFRNTYPLFSKNGRHLGAVEISFSSDNVQNYLATISKIHTHFLVNKKIFKAHTWKRDDLVLKYVQSAEHEDFMLSMRGLHSQEKCITENKHNFEEQRDEIQNGMKNQKKFAVYSFLDNYDVTIASFFPIKGVLGDETLAWLVSYEKSPFIFSTLMSTNIIRTIFALFFLGLFYLSYKLLLAKDTIEREHKTLNDVLNTTDDIMFSTNFQRINFSNRKFKEFFDVDDGEDFKIKHNRFLDLFIKQDGYLHKDILKKDESFSELIQRTPKDKRVILILDKHLNPKSFNIALSKTADNGFATYLVTLTDITKLKEKELAIQKKAYIDSLTGVYNRNKFDDIVKQEFNRSVRYKRNLSIALVDIDHFKNFNDKFGHLVGDDVLILLAQNLNSKVRETDTFARWGGEEFVILFPETQIEEARIICEKLRQEVEKIIHPEAGSVTASFGVTQYKENDTIESIFKRCDEALYSAKEQGRNRIASN